MVEHGNITEAADALGLTAPAVHSSLKNLENTVGSQLLHRDGRDRNHPTEQGKIVLRAYAEIRASLGRAIHTINALDSGRAGSVVLGVVSTAKYFAPRIVALLNLAYPEIDISLRVGNRAETIEGLRLGAFDICIMGRPPRSPVMDAMTLADHPHYIIAAPSHPLVGRPTVTADDLFAQRFILREDGSGTRILSTRFLDDYGQGRVADTIEMGSNETIKQAVKSGLGIALISAHTIMDELETGRLAVLNVPGTPIVRQWYMLTPEHLADNPAAQNISGLLASDPDHFIPKVDLTQASSSASQ